MEQQTSTPFFVHCSWTTEVQKHKRMAGGCVQNYSMKQNHNKPVIHPIFIQKKIYKSLSFWTCLYRIKKKCIRLHTGIYKETQRNVKKLYTGFT